MFESRASRLFLIFSSLSMTMTLSKNVSIGSFSLKSGSKFSSESSVSTIFINSNKAISALSINSCELQRSVRIKILIFRHSRVPLLRWKMICYHLTIIRIGFDEILMGSAGDKFVFIEQKDPVTRIDGSKAMSSNK